MFKRRKPLTPLQHLREMFWPSMGWRRAVRYTRYRIVRLSDSSHKIAIGLASGAAVSFSPLIGTHFIQAGILSWLLRGNILAALIGTFVGNPWTFPFIWWGSMEFGAFCLGLSGFPVSRSLPPDLDINGIWQLFTHEPMRVFVPWMLGGYILAAVVFLPTYLVYYYFVRAAKAARSRARLRRVHRVAREMTGQED